MKVLILLIKDFLKNQIRKLYWLYRLLKAKKGAGFQIQFPVRTEGSGKLSFGKNCKIQKNVFLGCGVNSNISFGNNCRIDEGVEIVTGKSAKIIFGDNCWIMKNTIIRTEAEFEIGNDVAIATNCAIFSREGGYQGKLKIGDGTHIGDYTIIDMADNLTVEKEIAIGPNCTIYTHDHNYEVEDKAAWKGGVVPKPITIKKGAWVGSSVTLLPGIEIGEKSVVAANAVVTKNVDANCIYGGIPAKKIKEI